MKLFPAKYHERATWRKLWRQTGNSSPLPAKCWPLLHEIAGISTRFSNFAFVLFCYITNSEFCFPRISMFPETKSRETLRFEGNKIDCSPRDQSLSVKYYIAKYITFSHLFCYSASASASLTNALAMTQKAFFHAKKSLESVYIVTKPLLKWHSHPLALQIPGCSSWKLGKCLVKSIWQHDEK